jgi:hypothetical protein
MIDGIGGRGPLVSIIAGTSEDRPIVRGRSACLLARLCILDKAGDITLLVAMTMRADSYTR